MSESDEPRAFGFSIPMPQAVVEEHERHMMQAEDRMASVNRLFDNLTVEQLMALRTILNVSKPEQMRVHQAVRLGAVLRAIVDEDIDRAEAELGMLPADVVEQLGDAGEKLSSLAHASLNGRLT